jgi:hypothetical protein
LDFARSALGATGACPFGCSEVCEMRPTCHSWITMRPPAACTALVTFFHPATCAAL